MTSYISDHVERGVSLIVSQFLTRAPALVAIAAAFLEEVQLAEDTLLDLASDLNVDAATGAQLDLLGALLGERRDNLDDATYRRYLRARMMIRVSQGAIDEILEIASILSGGTVEYSPAYPAGYSLHLSSYIADPTLQQRFKARMLEATPAGVWLDVTQSSSPTPFTFDVDGLGFDDGDLVEVF